MMPRPLARFLPLISLGLAACATAQTSAPPSAAPADATAAFRDRLPSEEIVYFVLPDRFENGDTSNDRGGFTGGPMETGFDPAHKGFFHGGS